MKGTCKYTPGYAPKCLTTESRASIRMYIRSLNNSITYSKGSVKRMSGVFATSTNEYVHLLSDLILKQETLPAVIVRGIPVLSPKLKETLLLILMKPSYVHTPVIATDLQSITALKSMVISEGIRLQMAHTRLLKATTRYTSSKDALKAMQSYGMAPR